MFAVKPRIETVFRIVVIAALLAGASARIGHFDHAEQRRPVGGARQSERRRGRVQERFTPRDGQRDRVGALLRRRLHRLVVLQRQRRDRR